ncbi:MAG: hypothetical protein A3B30_01190 [Candidatus Komeilibacteria bacterium RIFCSPLOWO2_01_FULL_52_15]|uniref:Uncharacterized protein n=1 Tax=Candidatus Komeilibacteria bacterium RIFCSPLOWO2_01_FULL_52_15 TaxID=1798551 RepID=A0A1G2BUF0_9BACT|nr:MAG: hypothetical protein A3B30_01190 [Candidatus Komeilibacteria bacterium RIFCSPLOWO2_01_FULL_52_15]
MAEYADTMEAGAVEQDIAQQAAAREFRLQTIEARRSRFMQPQGAGAAAGAAGTVERLAELKQRIRQIRAAWTIGGIAGSVTVIGLLVTIPVWNIRLWWKVLGLPGHEIFGLSWGMAVVVIFADILLFMAFLLLVILAYVHEHPFEAAFYAFTNLPSLAWDFFKLILQ